jgi:hypothetical protein
MYIGTADAGHFDPNQTLSGTEFRRDGVLTKLQRLFKGGQNGRRTRLRRHT